SRTTRAIGRASDTSRSWCAMRPGGRKRNGSGSHGVFIVSKGGDPRTGHQTQKPVAPMEILVRLFSNPGELILAPFTRVGHDGGGRRSNGTAIHRLGDERELHRR